MTAPRGRIFIGETKGLGPPRALARRALLSVAEKPHACPLLIPSPE